MNNPLLEKDRKTKTASWIHRISWDKYVCSGCSFEYDKPSIVCPNCKRRMMRVETF